MSTRETLCLAPGVSLSLAAEGRRLVTNREQVPLPPVSAGVGAALEALASGEHGLDELTGLAGQEGLTHAALFHTLLEGLRARVGLARALRLERTVIATLSPAAPRASGPGPREGVRYGLSRFVFTHAVDGALVLENPASDGRLWMKTWHGPALLGALATPRHPEDFRATVPGIPAQAAAAFLRMLMEMGALTELSAEGTPVEPEALMTWEFHDLLFHRQSRWGLREGIYGGATYRFKDRLPQPGKKPPPPSEPVALHVPDLSALRRDDVPFTEVLERRRSIRKHGSRPVTRAQLGELLYRAVGQRHVVFPGRGEGEARPFPSGGAIYETEVYIIVHQCEGLEEGLYYYRPDDHALYRVAGRSPDLELLLHAAMPGARLETPPQLMLVLTARFARVAWKYQTMAYAVMLKHVGVVMQTLYLVATAMGLAPCGLGGGSAELFARASGLDPLVEGSIGELFLGSAPEKS